MHLQQRDRISKIQPSSIHGNPPWDPNLCILTCPVALSFSLVFFLFLCLPVPLFHGSSELSCYLLHPFPPQVLTSGLTANPGTIASFDPTVSQLPQCMQLFSAKMTFYIPQRKRAVCQPCPGTILPYIRVRLGMAGKERGSRATDRCQITPHTWRRKSSSLPSTVSVTAVLTII